MSGRSQLFFVITQSLFIEIPQNWGNFEPYLIEKWPKGQQIMSKLSQLPHLSRFSSLFCRKNIQNKSDLKQKWVCDTIESMW